MEKKSRLAFDSDESTESMGEEVANEVDGPNPNDPKGNPHDYVDKEQTKDGVPLDKNNPEHLSLHEEAKSQEPGKGGERLVGIVEHEGHSASIHATEEGHIVKGKGSAGYLTSEPIASKEHAEAYAKEVLKAHAKLSEREICNKMTSLSETGGNQWESVTPKEKKEHWASLTGTSKHKLTACMNMVEGHVENPGSYCKSLADEVGYKPE